MPVMLALMRAEVGSTLKTLEDNMNRYAMSRLPESFNRQSRSQQLDEYITRKYSTYGYRRAKSVEYNPAFSPDYAKSDTYRWVENVSDGLREVGPAHKIINLSHTGWFNDNFQDETVHGVVYQLPAHDGECRYVPAVNDPCNDNCACVDFSSVTDDKEDAARWADRMAEMWAEDCRESQAKEDTEQRISDLTDDIAATYKEFRRITRELRASCDKVQGVAVVRELVRKEWQRTRATIHKMRAERTRVEQYGIEY